MALFPNRRAVFAHLAWLLPALFAPLFADVYILSLAMQIGYYGIAAIGLGILVGMSGQISMGHGALFGFGAFASAWLASRGIPVFFCIPLAGLMTTAAGMIFGVPATRIKGLYLAIATLAAQFILEDFFIRAEWFTGGAHGSAAEPMNIFGFIFDTDARYYYVVLGWFLLLTIAAVNLRRSRDGRALVAIRDHYLSAEMAGIRLNYYRLLAFGISSFYAGVGGALYAHYLGYVSAEGFTIFLSVQFLAMIIIGGMSTVAGAILGTAFIVLLPEVMEAISSTIAAWPPAESWGIADALPYFKEMAIGLAIVLFLIFDPDGLHHRWLLIKSYWRHYPFSR